ncbi:MAG TPA: NAD(P)H-dependent oxidoreductase subunit E [Anaerolineales bacterium]|nr:NAD(P)H-dependent oxidoreductase subunit E [Anaerolineales bacterium]
MEQEETKLDLESLVIKAIEKHGATHEAVIPILSDLNQILGYIPIASLPEIRRRIQIPEKKVILADSHLYSAASFYQLFSLKKLGRHIVRFCESAPCHVVGGREVIQTLQDELGIKPGETTEDMEWTLHMTSCLGVCAVGPVFMVDDDIYGNVTPEQVHGILAHYRHPIPVGVEPGD